MSALPSSYTLVWILGSLRVRGPQTNRPFSVTRGVKSHLGRACHAEQKQVLQATLWPHDEVASRWGKGAAARSTVQKPF